MRSPLATATLAKGGGTPAAPVHPLAGGTIKVQDDEITAIALGRLARQLQQKEMMISAGRVDMVKPTILPSALEVSHNPNCPEEELLCFRGQDPSIVRCVYGASCSEMSIAPASSCRFSGSKYTLQATRRIRRYSDLLTHFQPSTCAAKPLQVSNQRSDVGV